MSSSTNEPGPMIPPGPGNEQDTSKLALLQDKLRFSFWEAPNNTDGNKKIQIAVSMEDDAGVRRGTAFCNAYFFRRTNTNISLPSDIEWLQALINNDSSDLGRLGRDVFVAATWDDPHLLLREDLRSHPTKSGTAIWQDELDDGDILILSTLSVHIEEYCRQGIGTMMVNRIIERVRQFSQNFFIFALPRMKPNMEITGGNEILNTEEERLRRARELAGARIFLRHYGFRRVGTTKWLAFANDREHRSHLLSVHEDIDPPDPMMEEIGLDEHELIMVF